MPTAALGALTDQPVVLRVRSDPEPLQAVDAFDREGSIVASGADRPEIVAHAFEVKRGVLGIVLRKREILVSKIAYANWQSIIERLEPRVLEMPHARSKSKLFAAPSFKVRTGIIDEFVELATFGVRRNLFIENSGIEAVQPFAQLCELFG